MKIFILVLIFSLFNKLNCQKNPHEPAEVEEQEEEGLKEILTDKADANGGPVNTQELELQEDSADKVETELLQVDEEEDEIKQNAELKEILTDQESGLQDDQDKKIHNLPVIPDEAQNAELQEILTNKQNTEPQEDPADKVDTLKDEKEKDGDEVKQDAELQEDTPDKVDAEEFQDEEGDKKGDEVKNNETVQTCEECAYEKQKTSKEEVQLQDQDDKVKKALNIFPSGSGGGDVADLFGNNQHYKIPDNYQDFGRRFVLQYPYTKQHIENKEDSQGPLPIKAPPEFVLEIAKRSLLLEQTKPKNPTDDIIHKDILRSGNYWNDVQKEEVDPRKILHSTDSKYNLESVKVEIKPGSKLYNLISRLKEKSPRLLYVINKNMD